MCFIVGQNILGKCGTGSDFDDYYMYIWYNTKINVDGSSVFSLKK